MIPNTEQADTLELLDNIPEELRRKDANPTVELDSSNSAF